MEAKKMKILEALQMQPLSEEEKASRHILGRLYGPIATTKEKTRNGRGYNKELWEKALSDEIFREKIANKSLFLELGHPLDREETDMEKVCACIPEMPKIVDGDLYAYVDILDTNNGRLLKTLCDYGFVPGISSRGSGDIMSNDEVDPETFFLETWDIVQLPAVKKARLSVCESLGKKTLTMALRESLEKASAEEQAEMKDTLNKLNISLSEEVDPEVPFAPDPVEEDNTLLEDTNGIEEGIFDKFKKNKQIKSKRNELERRYGLYNRAGRMVYGPFDNEVLAELELKDLTKFSDARFNDLSVKELTEDDYKKYVKESLKEAADDEAEVEETPETENEAYTVKEMIKQLQDFDDKLDLEFKPIVIEDKEYEITALEFDDSEEGKIVVNINYNIPEVEETEEENNKLPEEENPEVEIEVSSEEEPAPEEEVEKSEEAVDDGDDEVFESLKEMVRQKDLLENEVRDLKNQKTVSDAEVKGLKEELERYKSGFMRVSELASKSTTLSKEVKSLKEQLEVKTSKINDLQAKIKTHTSLTESVNANEAKVKTLTERLVAVQTAAEKSEEELRGKLEESRKAVQQNANVAKKYKAQYTAVLERYIASKASMLGVRPTDITSRLGESYTLDNIDKVCEDLLDMGRPAFGLGLGQPKVKINESKVPAQKAQPLDPANGYEIDDDLLILAGLK